MDYKNVYNVDESDVQDVEEYAEPVEEVHGTVVDNTSQPANIDSKGIVFSIVSLVTGLCSLGWTLGQDLSYILCLISAGVCAFASLKYLFGGYHHKVFGKFAIIGFMISVVAVIVFSVRMKQDH